MKKFFISIILLSIFMIPFSFAETSSSSISWLSRASGDQRYCMQGGDCNVTNLYALNITTENINGTFSLNGTDIYDIFVPYNDSRHNVNLGSKGITAEYLLLTLDVRSGLVPDAAFTYDLGAGGAEWNDLYIGNVYATGSVEASDINADNYYNQGAGQQWGQADASGLTITADMNLDSYILRFGLGITDLVDVESIDFDSRVAHASDTSSQFTWYNAGTVNFYDNQIYGTDSVRITDTLLDDHGFRISNYGVYSIADTDFGSLSGAAHFENAISGDSVTIGDAARALTVSGNSLMTGGLSVGANLDMNGNDITEVEALHSDDKDLSLYVDSDAVGLNISSIDFAGIPGFGMPFLKAVPENPAIPFISFYRGLYLFTETGTDSNIFFSNMDSSDTMILQWNDNLDILKFLDADGGYWFDGSVVLDADDISLQVGAFQDSNISWDGTNTKFEQDDGDWVFRNPKTAPELRIENGGSASLDPCITLYRNSAEYWQLCNQVSNVNYFYRAHRTNGKHIFQSGTSDTTVTSINNTDADFTSLDVKTTGNFTGNQIYGSIYGDEIGNVVGTTNGVYYDVNATVAGEINGFVFNDSGRGGLKALIAGVYKVDSGWSFSGQANTEYHIRISVDGVEEQGCHAQRVIGTGADVGSASTSPCFVDLSVGEIVHMQIERISGTIPASIHDIGMTVWRIGD